MKITQVEVRERGHSSYMYVEACVEYCDIATKWKHKYYVDVELPRAEDSILTYLMSRAVEDLNEEVWYD